MISTAHIKPQFSIAERARVGDNSNSALMMQSLFLSPLRSLQASRGCRWMSTSKDNKASSSTAAPGTESDEQARQAWREKIAEEERANAERARQEAMQPPPSAKSTFGRFKELWSKYGWVFVVTYLAVYLSTWFSIYMLLTTPWISQLSFMRSINEWGASHLKDLQESVKMLKKMDINVAIAWVLTKPTEPVRAIITLAITPTIARLLGRVPKGESFRSSLRLSGQDKDKTSRMSVNLLLPAIAVSSVVDRFLRRPSDKK